MAYRSNSAAGTTGGQSPSGTAYPAHALLLDILDSIRDVVIIVSKDRRTLYCNRAAKELLRRKRPLRVDHGRLRCGTGETDQEFGRAIDGACNGELPAGRLLALATEADAPIVLALSCLDGSQALLIAADPTPHRDDVVGPLQQCFGLTRSEAMVAGDISEGRSIADIAEQRQVSINTIRSQVKAVAAKLGCARQSQITALVRALPLARSAPER